MRIALTIPARECKIPPISPRKWRSAPVIYSASQAEEAPMSDPAADPESSRQEPNRRRFLKGGVALGAALVAGAGRPLAGLAQPAPD
ncbi:MAG: twin-arginine translocation signal domain-containing protein, partial [Candidatus Entotheonellia bacterium]